MTAEDLKALPKVDIDTGTFKYILLKVYPKIEDQEETFKILVRGYQRCTFHSDIYDEVQELYNEFDMEPMGGGRIKHNYDKKTIHIYGYSQAYGKADHEQTAAILQREYPDYTITCCDDGY